MAGILNAAYSIAALALALVGMVYVFGMTDTGGETRSWWSWIVLVVVSVFLLAQVGMLLAG